MSNEAEQEQFTADQEDQQQIQGTEEVDEQVVEEEIPPPQFPLEPEEAAQYDLTSRLGRFLDCHMIFPLLEFITPREIYDESQLMKGKLDLLSNTNMVDFAIECYQTLQQTTDEPEELIEKRARVLNLLGALQQNCHSILTLLRDSDLMQKLISEKNFTFEYLSKNFEVTREAVDALYEYAKFQYECGNYSASAAYLYHFEFLSENFEKNMSALWGKFASEILNQNWDSALEDFSRLRDIIENKVSWAFTINNEFQCPNKKKKEFKDNMLTMYNETVFLDWAFKERFVLSAE
eukprot:TRINITY_DN1408_c0_g1_i1.p1 TRINITY_DN1408_c0_g1~~TRINITY_DN1408_c0_g1_i1.p1  ORF type:complete len:292 (+),score=62.61 TRINITY_DN1408_c0_g1_i1:100-975(+)